MNKESKKSNGAQFRAWTIENQLKQGLVFLIAYKISEL